MRQLLLIACLAAMIAAGGDARPRRVAVAVGRPLAVTTRPLPLDPTDPARTTVGRLRFMGAVAMTSPEPAFGSFSSLRWDGAALLSVADTGWWFRLTPREIRGRLVGVGAARFGPLLDRGGTRFPSKDAGDAESLTRSVAGGWLVGFEQDHRIWRYPRIDRAPVPTGIDPVALLGPMTSNHGVEAMAGDERNLFVCEEVASRDGRPNCRDGTRAMAVVPPEPIASLGGQPSDADRLGRRTFVLFRSYSPKDGQGSGFVMIGRDGRTVPLATLRPPMTLENMEGLAVRRSPRGKTWLYVITDNDNNPTRPLLLLEKFELVE